MATNKIEDIYNFSGSKYVKSNPKGIYEIVLKLLKQNNKVLFIGLPCQVVALKKYVGERLQHKLFTVDLICHGTPSEELLTAFLKQYLPIEKIKKITFRDNINCTIAIDGKKILPDRLVDCYTSIFMNGEIYTEGCYHCKYARNERVSDVTLGDSWNSSLPSEQKQKGISLILCQTEKGKDMIDSVDLRLYDIDLEIARKNNAQLNNPAKYSKKRYRFICGLNKGIQFNIMYYLIYPKMFLKNFVKMVLYKLRIWRIV